mmetsp:Transcript_24762/g.62156  ORF Transcript_24762/g.62156 Transcript_24762/m.62156 type:complete len:105 (+) Transcript_24762:185-499(+)
MPVGRACRPAGMPADVPADGALPHLLLFFVAALLRVRQRACTCALLLRVLGGGGGGGGGGTAGCIGGLSGAVHTLAAYLAAHSAHWQGSTSGRPRRELLEGLCD